MRFDDIGFFWQDIVEEKILKVKIKREAPDPVWLRDDYLPGLDEARAYRFNLMTDAELLAAQQAREPLIWDTEFYPNYALIGFQSVVSGKIVMFEFQRGEACPQLDKLLWIVRSFTLIGFNDTGFDLPMVTAVLAGYSTDRLMDAVGDIIFGGELRQGMSPRDFYKAHKLAPPVVDHIDLLELTPLGPSLKVCAGRLHAPRMQDLPFPPGKELTPEQIEILRWYWVNDLDNTKLLYRFHRNAIELRTIMTHEYGVDVRSKSDPQIAEAVIRHEIQRITKSRYLPRAEIVPGRTFRYSPPAYLAYQTPTMRWVLDFIREQDFVVDQRGGPLMPKALEGLDIPIGASAYRMGIGGLHSKEKRTIHRADEHWELTDNDVTSYYPSLILQQGMYPPQIGPVFLKVFKRIYDRRLAAKRDGDKETSETLKIVLNGTFGKTGERGGYSVVYYPEMMIQVTVTGQLSLLMLIEALELNGIPVVSANTDGIVIKCPRHLLELKAQIIAWWERATGLGMESTPYKAIYSRDVNSYLAFYDKPKGDQYAKTKGAYSFVKDSVLKVNPTTEICIEAVILWIAKSTPIEDTIRACTDIRKFLAVRLVRGGACKDGEYLGKAIRWYYAEGVEGELINAKNGHSVPTSQGARPLMRLPDALPEDINYQWYIDKAYGILEDFSPVQDDKEEKAA